MRSSRGRRLSALFLKKDLTPRRYETLKSKKKKKMRKEPVCAKIIAAISGRRSVGAFSLSDFFISTDDEIRGDGEMYRD